MKAQLRHILKLKRRKTSKEKRLDLQVQLPKKSKNAHSSMVQSQILRKQTRGLYSILFSNSTFQFSFIATLSIRSSSSGVHASTLSRCFFYKVFSSSFSSFVSYLSIPFFTVIVSKSRMYKYHFVFTFTFPHEFAGDFDLQASAHRLDLHDSSLVELHSVDRFSYGATHSLDVGKRSLSRLSKSAVLKSSYVWSTSTEILQRQLLESNAQLNHTD